MLYNRQKDPDDITYHTWQWLDFLDGETIAASAWQVQTGITQDSATTSGTNTTIWLSAGTVGESYKISNQITTSSGRKKTQSFNITITEL